MRNVAWIRIAGVGLAVGAVLLSGCAAMVKGKSDAEAGVAAVHQKFNDGTIREIYLDADDMLRKYATEKEFVESFTEARKLLGKVKDSRQIGFYMRTVNGRNTVELSYRTTFEKGSGTERFIFHLTGGKAHLQLYGIDAAELDAMAKSKAAPAKSAP